MHREKRADEKKDMKVRNIEKENDEDEEERKRKLKKVCFEHLFSILSMSGMQLQRFIPCYHQNVWVTLLLTFAIFDLPLNSILGYKKGRRTNETDGQTAKIR